MTELALRDDRAILPGSFDPPTRGHFDVIRRAAPLFARLVVAVVENPEKRSLFTAEERVELIERELHDLARVRQAFPQTLLLAREAVACGPTAEVLTPAHLARTRGMVEAFDDHAAACDAPEAMTEPHVHADGHGHEHAHGHGHRPGGRRGAAG